MAIHQWQIKQKSFTFVDDTKAKKIALSYIKNGDSILDVGCGDCSFFDIVAKNRKNCKLYGYDIIGEALELCKNKSYNPVSSLRNVKRSFDVITLFECFEHFDFNGRMELAETIDRILRRGGFVVISFPHVKSMLSMQHYFDNPEHKIPYPYETNLIKIFSKYFIIDKVYFNPWLNPLKIIHCIMTGMSIDAIYNNICYVLVKKK